MRARWCVISLALAGAAILALPFPLCAQTNPRTQAVGKASIHIVATVGDRVITNFDVIDYLRLSRLTLPPNRQPQREDALRALIEDRVKLNEAEKLSITVPGAELLTTLNSFSRSLGQDWEGLRKRIARLGISEETPVSIIRANLAWRRVVRQRVGQRTRPSREQIDRAVARAAVQDERFAYRYDLVHLILPLAPDAERAQVDQAFEEANETRERMGECDAIDASADRYGAGSGRSRALTMADMPEFLRDRVAILREGDRSDVFRSAAGLHVVKICARSGGPAQELLSQINARLAERSFLIAANELLRSAVREADIRIR